MKKALFTLCISLFFVNSSICQFHDSSIRINEYYKGKRQQKVADIRRAIDDDLIATFKRYATKKINPLKKELLKTLQEDPESILNKKDFSKKSLSKKDQADCICQVVKMGSNKEKQDLAILLLLKMVDDWGFDLNHPNSDHQYPLSVAVYQFADKRTLSPSLVLAVLDKKANPYIGGEYSPFEKILLDISMEYALGTESDEFLNRIAWILNLFSTYYPQQTKKHLIHEKANLEYREEIEFINSLLPFSNE